MEAKTGGEGAGGGDKKEEEKNFHDILLDWNECDLLIGKKNECDGEWGRTVFIKKFEGFILF